MQMRRWRSRMTVYEHKEGTAPVNIADVTCQPIENIVKRDVQHCFVVHRVNIVS